MSNQGDLNDEIVIKQEPIKDDKEECSEYVYGTFDGSNGPLDVPPLKPEVENEPTDEPYTENVYALLPQIKDEIKKEILQENSSSNSQVCEVWLDRNQEDQYYSENVKAELEDEDLSEGNDQEDERPASLEEFFPDVMPHFLTSGAESERIMGPKIVNCHKCGEVLNAKKYMEHIDLKHTQKAKLNKPVVHKNPKTKKKAKNVRKYIYPCPYCDRFTYSFGTLKIHILTHTQEKPHKCPFCDYQANQSINVDKHIQNKHLNCKRFKCDLCDYTCISFNILKRHKRRHRIKKKEPIQCPYCQFITYKQLCLRKHVKKCYKGITESNIVLIKEEDNSKSLIIT